MSSITLISLIAEDEGGGNKPGRGTKVEKSINVQEGINEEVERNLRNQ